MPHATASQTIGPYWHLLEDKDWTDLTRFGAQGERIALTGRIIDGDGALVTDACVELWQASPAASDQWDGFGRAATDKQGEFRFVTLKPGPVPVSPGGKVMQAPHISLAIFARGLMTHLHTRVYFQGEALNAQDPLLCALPDTRRGTLIAQEQAPGLWRLDIVLQGDGETVFLDV